MTTAADYTGIVRIGTEIVRIENLPASLSSLATVAAGACADEFAGVRIAFTTVNAPDWPIVSGAVGDRWIHSCPEHRSATHLVNRTIEFRCCRRLTAQGQYMILRDVFCALAAFAGDPLIHGSAVIDENGAALFCGPSGMGKSTIAKMLAPTAEVVNDEINWAVADGKGGFLLVNQRHWQPVATRFSQLVPLRSVYLLSQAADCRLEPADPMTAFGLLLAAPYGGADPGLPARAAATARLATAVPVWNLAFNLDAPAVRDLVGRHGRA